MQMILHKTEFSITKFYISSADSWVFQMWTSLGWIYEKSDTKHFHLIGHIHWLIYLSPFTAWYIYVYNVCFLCCNYLPSTLLYVELCEDICIIGICYGHCYFYLLKAAIPCDFPTCWYFCQPFNNLDSKTVLSLFFITTSHQTSC